MQKVIVTRSERLNLAHFLKRMFLYFSIKLPNEGTDNLLTTKMMDLIESLYIIHV